MLRVSLYFSVIKLNVKSLALLLLTLTLPFKIPQITKFVLIFSILKKSDFPNPHPFPEMFFIHSKKFNAYNFFLMNSLNE